MTKKTSHVGHVKIGLRSVIDPSAKIGTERGRASTLGTLKIGNGALIRSGSVIYAGSTIGDDFETGHNVVIREENRIGRGFRIWNHSTVDYGCRIGQRVKIHSSCYIAQYSVLEDDVFLAPGVILANDLYPGLEVSAKNLKGPHLERGVQVGVNSTILPFVRVGQGSLIGAGAVVTRDVPPHSVVYGNPAKVHGRVKPDDWAKIVREKIS